MRKMLKKILKLFVIYIPFIIIWYIVFYVMIMGNAEGLLSIYKDAYGEWINFIGIIFIIVTITSVVYLRIFIKKEWKIQCVAYTLTFLFVLSSNILAIKGYEKFQEFTTEKWLSYPNRRINMYFDFVKKYNIFGLSYSEVEKLLGIPDKIEGDKYIYDDRYNNTITIYFKNGKVVNYGYVE